MVMIRFVDSVGSEYSIEAEVGSSLMQAAIDNGVPGIMADCGGSCTCATCHCYVSEKYAPIVGEMGDMEDAMLEAAIDRKDTSRLSCQILVSEDMEGIEIELPASQY